MTLRKPHPCAGWCQGQLRGIVENLRLREEVGEDFEVEVWSVRGIRIIPPHTTILTCEHGRAYAVRETKASRARSVEQ